MIVRMKGFDAEEKQYLRRVSEAIHLYQKDFLDILKLGTVSQKVEVCFVLSTPLCWSYLVKDFSISHENQTQLICAHLPKK